jgi:predicted aspartyl protease
MDTFLITLGVRDPQGQRYESIDALVDTGATYTAVRGSLLRRLGVAEEGMCTFDLADGRQVERPLGYTRVRIDGRSAIVPVVFADERAGSLLGAVALEIFGLGVDPVRRRLVPVNGLLM